MAAYADSATSSNFAFAQDAFQYQGYAFSTVNASNVALTTNADDNNGSLAQAALQHVVMTYDPTPWARDLCGWAAELRHHDPRPAAQGSIWTN